MCTFYKLSLSMSSAWFWCRSVLSWVLSSMSNASFVASSIRNRGDSSVGFPYTTNMAPAHDVLKSSWTMDEAPRFWGSVEVLKFLLNDLKIGGQNVAKSESFWLLLSSCWFTLGVPELESAIWTAQTNLSCPLQDSLFLNLCSLWHSHFAAILPTA